MDCVQHLSASGTTNLTAATATNASTASCTHACSKFPAVNAFIAANDASSTIKKASAKLAFVFL